MKINTYIVNGLQWQNKQDGTIYSECRSLRSSYYITPVDNQFEVVLLDHHGNVGNELFMMCQTLKDAQLKAYEHYSDTINKIVLESGAKVKKP